MRMPVLMQTYHEGDKRLRWRWVWFKVGTPEWWRAIGFPRSEEL